ncbi:MULTISPECIES: hypothetical protein [unclassified Streptomyces]|uniref:hypothetical protein n=1 Tax=unclassified Streptomyces TaxID=2593676 RepID=UPI00035F46B3|nr:MULTISPECIES: hypothetical protein [unclassified Streptomyces]MYT31328.1 hypothetical protein [Streptomyces sp. SID8354]
MFNFHPSRIAAAAVLAALPAVGFAVTAAPAHADAPTPAHHQPKDGHDDDSMGGGLSGMNGLGSGLLDHDHGDHGDEGGEGGEGGHGSMMGGLGGLG